MEVLLFSAFSALLSCIAPLSAGIYVLCKSGINGKISGEATVYLVLWLACITIPIVNIVSSIPFAIELAEEDY